MPNLDGADLRDEEPWRAETDVAPAAVAGMERQEKKTEFIKIRLDCTQCRVQSMWPGVRSGGVWAGGIPKTGMQT